ncbi:MAG TPA: carboxymuconolactone decarboxylase family protein [Longimicrobiaceae bacterium]|jgi:AhpD family alkylhydroperoxidase
MEPRIDYRQVSPGALGAMFGLERYVRESGMEHSLLELVKLRVSQINGCAYCVDMHSKDARAAGEGEQRLYAVSVWRETPFFSARERAGLAWAEALTLVSEGGVPDDLYSHAREHFTEKELVDLTMATVSINGWNRIAIRSAPPWASTSRPRRSGPR